MLKLSTSSVQAAVKQPVGCSEEALVESINALSDASEALYSACADVEEVSTVLANLEMCAKGIKAGGLTKQTIAAFNSEGELSACVGQECLTVAGLESLGEEQVKQLTATYSAGLEGKMAEYWNKLVAFLKNLFVKVKNWFVTLWQNRARLFKSLDDVKMMKEFNGEAKADVVSNEAYNKLYDVQQEIIKGLATFKQEYVSGKDRVSTFDASIKEYQNKIDAILKDASNEDTLTQRGWNLTKLQAGAANFSNSVKPGGQMAAMTTWITGALDQLVKKAGSAGAEDDATKSAALKESVNKQRAALSSALAAVRLENSLVLKMFNILHKVKKAALKKGESKPAEQKPAETK